MDKVQRVKELCAIIVSAEKELLYLIGGGGSKGIT